MTTKQKATELVARFGGTGVVTYAGTVSAPSDVIPVFYIARVFEKNEKTIRAHCHKLGIALSDIRRRDLPRIALSIVESTSRPHLAKRNTQGKGPLRRPSKIKKEMFDS